MRTKSIFGFFAFFLVTVSCPAQSQAEPQIKTYHNQSRHSSQPLQLSEQPDYAGQAAEHFDEFAAMIPSVIAGRLDEYYKYGSRALMMEAPKTKADEEIMIRALIDALKDVGAGLEEDSKPKR